MSFLDKKYRILDVALTNKGRELLSRNQLTFDFYAFSDYGVDYSGALSCSIINSTSIDYEIRKNTHITEATQYQRLADLPTFLYTIPSGRKVLPRFTTNFDERDEEIILKRRYYIDALILSAQKKKSIQKPISVLMRATTQKQTVEQKLQNYVNQQQNQEAVVAYINEENIVGKYVAADWVAINNVQAINVNSGLVKDLIEFIQPESLSIDINAFSSEKTVEVISGLSRAKFNFTLKSSEGEVTSKSGFLVEIFDSGSDGALVRLTDENSLDVVKDTVTNKGYDNFLFVDVDTENAELITDFEHIVREEERKQSVRLDRLQKQLRSQVSEIRREKK